MTRTITLTEQERDRVMDTHPAIDISQNIINLAKERGHDIVGKNFKYDFETGIISWEEE